MWYYLVLEEFASVETYDAAGITSKSIGDERQCNLPLGNRRRRFSDHDGASKCCKSKTNSFEREELGIDV